MILDADLASLYGVPTKRLNEQVGRNIERFPDDFMFQLTAREKQEVVANCDHLSKLRFSNSLPYAFTEHGTLMAANVLRTPAAVQVSLQIVRTFVKLRRLLTSHQELSNRLNELEQKYDSQFQVVFDAIRRLMEPASKAPGRRIGFARENEKKS